MDIPTKYKKLWQACLPYFKEGRPGDEEHALETVALVLKYKEEMDIDEDILIPVAIMHDIGHSAILPEHFKHVTGPEKVKHGKLVHMLTGAKIARDILAHVGYDAAKTVEIADIISVHDMDMLEDVEWKQYYDSENKKLFHDFDRLDRFNERRFTFLKTTMYKGDTEKLLSILRNNLADFFFDRFRRVAKEHLEALREKYA